MPFSIERELETLPADIQNEAKDRLGRLDTLLQERYSLSLRDDSSLAFLYATSRMAPDVFETRSVLKEMAMTQQLYAKKHFDEAQQATLRRVADRLKKAFPHVSWQKVWHDVKVYICPMMKILSLDKVTDNEDEAQHEDEPALERTMSEIQ